MSVLTSKTDLPTMKPMRLAILGSGKGSNFQALLDAIKEGQLKAEIAMVVSDVKDSGVLRIAEESDLPSLFLECTKFKTRLDPDLEARLAECLQQEEVDFVVLAGFMRILKEPMLKAFPKRILNIHPSLLPKHPGLEAWKQALEAGDEISGCTVHYVDERIDTGEIIAQGEVDVFPGDTPETLHDRIQRAEHLLFPMVLQRLGELRMPA